MKRAKMNRSSNSNIRLIGGKWRSRQIEVLNQVGLRPTTDRIRETLFNWIAPMIHGAVCLDLFAGSGALGFECLSRGAQQVLFIEHSKSAIQQLQKNKQKLDAHSAEICHLDALDYLHSNPKTAFDLVFIDPPFHQNWLERVLVQIEARLKFNQGALIYIESELKSHFEVPSHWFLFREKTTKQLKAQLFKVN